jgi:hypothetical protein
MIYYNAIFFIENGDLSHDIEASTEIPDPSRTSRPGLDPLRVQRSIHTDYTYDGCDSHSHISAE